jgi:hypothetical protein
MSESIVAAALLAALPLTSAHADGDVQSILSAVMGKTCSGIIGRETPVQIFLQPVKQGNGVVMNMWGDAVKSGVRTAATSSNYRGQFAVTTTPTGDVTFTTSQSSVYVLSVQGNNLVGKARGSPPIAIEAIARSDALFAIECDINRLALAFRRVTLAAAWCNQFALAGGFPWRSPLCRFLLRRPFSRRHHILNVCERSSCASRTSVQPGLAVISRNVRHTAATS